MNADDAIDMLEEVFGRCGSEDGVPATELDAAARRLGVALPAALQTLYLRTGRNVRLHQSHDHLVAPVDLTVEVDHLMFYRESQSVCVWGIPLDAVLMDDPPVDVSYREAQKRTWVRAFDRVSQMVVVQGAWQAVHGGLPVSALVTGASVAGVAKATEVRGAKVLAAAARVGHERIAAGGSTVWTLFGCILVAEAGDFFGLGARDEDSFFSASNALGMSLEEWDYASLRDGPAVLD
jgi:hypothetical protein